MFIQLLFSQNIHYEKVQQKKIVKYLTHMDYAMCVKLKQHTADTDTFN